MDADITGSPDGDALAQVYKLADFEPLARDRLTTEAYAYYAGGAGDEVTLEDNVAAFRRFRLRPRVLVDVSEVELATEMLGTRVSMPVGLSPNALHALADPEGEVATARAAAGAGVVMCLSTMSNRSLEEVAAAADGPMWFQLYVHRDRGISRAMVKRAAAAGYRAIVLTADLPHPGYREHELRHPIRLGDEDRFGNFEGLVDPAGATMLEMLEGIVNATVTWDDLGWITAASALPLVLKGVLTREDARLAVDHGVSGIVVSNHGGRQLDRSPATIDVLEEVVQEAAGACEVYLDSGVRRGVDVVTALALGARAAFIGRPYLYALATAGERGVARALALMRAEVANAMALVGATSVGHITRAHVLP